MGDNDRELSVSRSCCAQRVSLSAEAIADAAGNDVGHFVTPPSVTHGSSGLRERDTSVLCSEPSLDVRRDAQVGTASTLPCRPSLHHWYGGTPSRGTAAAVLSRMDCFSASVSLETRSAARASIGRDWLQNGSLVDASPTAHIVGQSGPLATTTTGVPTSILRTDMAMMIDQSPGGTAVSMYCKVFLDV